MQQKHILYSHTVLFCSCYPWSCPSTTTVALQYDQQSYSKLFPKQLLCFLIVLICFYSKAQHQTANGNRQNKSLKTFSHPRGKLSKFPCVDIQKYISSEFSPAVGALHLNATLLDSRQCPSASLYRNSKLGRGARSIEELSPLQRHTRASRQNMSL